MALEKIEVVDLIEVVENGCIQVRTKTAFKEDGVEIGSKFHRHVVVPGADEMASVAGRIITDSVGAFTSPPRWNGPIGRVWPVGWSTYCTLTSRAIKVDSESDLLVRSPPCQGEQGG